MRTAPLLLFLLACTSCTAEVPSTPEHAAPGVAAGSNASRIAVVSGLRAKGPDARAVVTAVDAERNVPRFVWVGSGVMPRAAADSPEQAARSHLERYAALYRLPRAALNTAFVYHTHDTGRGAVIVRFRQQIDGLPVLDSELKVVMRRDHELVALVGNLHPGTSAERRARFTVAVEDALSTAVADSAGLGVAARKFLLVSRDSAGFDRYELPASEVYMARPARVRKVFAKSGELLVPAYELELDVAPAGSTSPLGYAYVIAADTGALLDQRDLTLNESFQYRVWADTSAPHAPPMDGPTDDSTPHPTGTPNGFVPAWAEPGLVSVEGFNTNPDNGSDPWLPAGASETRGNNVDAYADHNEPDGFSAGDLRATVTSAGVFDRVYDVAADPLEDDAQVMAAITQIFYTTNWLHDWFYDSGFTEAAGNAQDDNYGRGGADGDALRIEGQDTGGDQTNNANMATFSDGSPPRMQMYLWTGVATELGETSLEVTSPTSIAGSYDASPPSFGATEQLSASGDLVLAVDGGGDSTTDACESITNNVAGQIVVIDRGSCPFSQKASAAQSAGAAGVVIANNNTGSPASLPPLGGDDNSITIPVLGVSYNTGVTLKGALADGAVAGQVNKAEVVPGLRRDGTIDNGIVAHEWGHYLHNRLVVCGSKQCGGQGEGWGDTIALYMMLREGDSTEGVYAVAGYSTAILGDSYYFGIRRVPYSTNFDVNALTFRHISDGEPLPDEHPMNPVGGGQQRRDP